MKFGLDPIFVPFDPALDRKIKHESSLYYGVSLSAINHHRVLHWYSLLEVSHNGVNVFFVRDDLFSSPDLKFRVEDAYSAKCYPYAITSTQNWVPY